jgi:hypothetical protein
MYALQHIAMWIPDEPSEESREAMMGYLRKLSWSADDPLAGSAVFRSGLRTCETFLPRIRMNYQGTVFPDGSRNLVLRARDFSSNGIANVIVETSSDPPQLCHSMHAVLID